VTSPALVGALEIGGTHVTSTLVSTERRAIDTTGMQRDELAAHGTRDDLVRSIVAAVRRVSRPGVARWGVATPGPFDYANGISLIRGVAKLEALYGVDLRAELSAALSLRPQDVLFLNDADAFLIGEWWAGAARGHERAIAVTLGTGLGSAFIERGQIIEADPRVPPEGRLDLISFRGAPVEETLSRRGLRAAYDDDDPDVIEIARRARAGERRATSVFSGFGKALGEFLAPWLERFAPTCLVLGGSIARSWDLWRDDFRAACSPYMDLTWYGVAEHLDEAPLLGAAYHAAGGDAVIPPPASRG
jgi:glucokinase